VVLQVFSKEGEQTKNRKKAPRKINSPSEQNISKAKIEPKVEHPFRSQSFGFRKLFIVGWLKIDSKLAIAGYSCKCFEWDQMTRDARGLSV